MSGRRFGAARRPSRKAREFDELIRKLRDDGYQSEYLERLRKTVSVEESVELVEQELHGEVAAALGRSAAKVDYALLKLELAGKALREAGPAERLEREAEWRACRAEALRRRRDLLIHREAVGITNNAVLKELYPIPERP